MTVVLIIALEFAPVQTTGAFRSIELVKRLPALGFTPIVVTIDAEEAAASFGAPINAAIGAGLPPDLHRVALRVGRAPAREGPLRRYWRLLTTLNDRFHERYAEAMAREIRKLDQPIAAVYVSAPPFGATQLGIMASRLTGAPLVLDMRDAWSAWANAPLTTYAHHLARRRDEAHAFRAADRIITVTDQLRQVFLADNPGLAPEKVTVVPNGFDGEDFDDRLIVAEGGGATFDIAYVGSYYWSPTDRSMTDAYKLQRLLQYRLTSEDWSYRSPLYFFRAWKVLQAINAAAAARLRFHHIGQVPSWLDDMALAHGVRAQCIFHGQIPKQEVGTTLAGMDAVLATSMKREQGGDYCLASKTFEYVQAGKPILAFVTPGAQRDFLLGSGVAMFADPDDPWGAAQVLERLAEEGVRLRLNAQFVNRYSRNRTARENVEVLRATIAQCL